MSIHSKLYHKSDNFSSTSVYTGKIIRNIHLSMYFCVLLANLLVQYCKIEVYASRMEVYGLADATKVRELAIAIYTVNRHAKTAPDNRSLYQLKKEAITKLLNSGDAEKIGLHFVENPKFSKQHSTVLVRCGEFLFHTLPEKEDFVKLPHLGEQDMEFRNPQERMSLKVARELLTAFTGAPVVTTVKPSSKTSQPKRRRVSNTEVFRSSYLDGKH